MFRLKSIPVFICALFSCAIPISATAPPPYGVGNCQPTLKSYSTISQAVSSVPPNSTIEVCPGNYPEQVLITQPLTLKGILVGGSGAAVVTVPAGNFTQNVSDHFGTTFYYQILVQNTPGVNISDLGVDGTGGDASGNGSVAGIYYQDASGVVSKVSVRNQVTSSHNGVGIVADSFVSPQIVTIQNSAIHGFDNLGIISRTDPNSATLTATIKSNTIRGQGPSLFTSGVYVFGATDNIQLNSISDVAQTIGLYAAASSVTSNTLYGNNPYEATFLIDGGSNTVKYNKMDAGGKYGLQLLNAGNNVVQGNTIANSSTAVYGCFNNVSGNTISGNTLIDANVGISIPSNNNFVPNQYLVVVTAVVPCT